MGPVVVQENMLVEIGIFYGYCRDIATRACYFDIHQEIWSKIMGKSTHNKRRGARIY
jgi:hypothetical protein